MKDEEVPEMETQVVRVEEAQPPEVVQPKAMSIFDVPSELFAAALDRRKANRDALIKWVRSALVEGTDFGKIEIQGRKAKPSLWKPGAEKICGMLGVIPTFPNMKDYEQAAVSGVALEHILIRCHLLDSHGNVVAEGAGARSISREKGDVNKTIKMAQKSAHIDATLRMAGLSEIFTQDLEQMVEDASFDKAGGGDGAFVNRVDKDWRAELDKHGMGDGPNPVADAVHEVMDRCEKCGSKLEEFTAQRGPMKGRQMLRCAASARAFAEAQAEGKSREEAKKASQGHTIKVKGAGKEPARDEPTPQGSISSTPAPSFSQQLQEVSDKVAQKLAKEAGPQEPAF